jgi:hypothetical protein
VNVPRFFPDNATVRNDMLDYGFEVEYSDSHLVRMINKLEAIGELENTIIIVTGDHGMPFPRCKTNLHEWGVHVPFAVRWGARVPGGRSVDDLVSFIDIAPTLLDAAGIEPPPDMRMHGKSLLNVLESTEQGQVDPTRTAVLLGTDRHSPNDANESLTGMLGAGYPIRGLRTTNFLYIRNYEPTWTPNGSDGGPTKTYIESHQSEAPGLGIPKTYFQLTLGTREAEELYDITSDSECMFNLASDPAHLATLETLRNQMESALKQHIDPRILGYGEIFFGYPYQKDSLGYFQPWLTLAENFLLADSNGDGVSNASKLLFQSETGNPWSTARPAPSEGAVAAAAAFQYTFSPELPEIVPTVEWSTGLQAWRADQVSESVVERTPTSQTNEARVPSGAGEPKFFFRIATTPHLRNDD